MLLRVREDVPIRTEVKDPDTNKRIEAFDKDENPVIKYAIICKYTITRGGGGNLLTRKPVFRISDQVQHKPGCTITEDY